METDLTAKARRAAEWYRSKDVPVVETDDFMFAFEDMAAITPSFFVAVAKMDGWQDQDQEAELVIPTEEETLDLCASGMAQTMDEIAPDPSQLDADEPSDAAYIELAKHCEAEGMIGIEESESILSNIRYGNSHIEADEVEWKTTHECHRFAEDIWLNVYWCYDKKFRWEVFVTGPEHGAKAKGTSPTRAEARAAAVEAARGMGENEERS